MQNIGLDKEPANPVDPSAPHTGFWKRQFQQEQTSGQRVFDMIFGVVMPAVCFYFDPIVFKIGKFATPINNGQTLFGQYRPFAYLFTFAAIIAMTGWLLRIESIRSFPAAFGSLFAVGATIAFIVGVILLPFSLFGLIIVIGVLGFVPLFTSFVYLRNSVISLRIARTALQRRSLIYAGLLTALFSLVVPYVANIEIDRQLKEVMQGDAATIDNNVNRLRWAAPLVNTDKFIDAYSEERYKDDQSRRKQALANAYYQITGDDLATAVENSCPGC